MSGGVDSAVACAEMVRRGFDVSGLFMQLTDEHERALKGDFDDAKRVAEHLGVAIEAIDFSADIRAVIDYFIGEYAVGRTPNPCVRCNRQLKFGRLLAEARRRGAEVLATGHYARIVQHAGRARLARAACRAKDQSYVLFGIAADDLASIAFPNGEAASKQAVREQAKSLGFDVHSKRDSQEICFVPDDNFARLVLEHRPELKRRGPIVDVDGRVVGEHDGVFQYTIGQRRGLRVAAGVPMYVVRTDVATQTVVIGPREAMLRTTLIAEGLLWHDRPTSSMFRAVAQIRSMHSGAEATITIDDTTNSATVVFDEPQFAVTPGQAVVFYEGDIVGGGGWIA